MGETTDVTDDVELVEPESWTESGEQYATWKYEAYGEVITWSVEYLISEPNQSEE